MHSLSLVFLILIAFSATPKAMASEFFLCPSIVFDEKPPFKLAPDETQLVCGNKKADDVSSKAWAEIAPAQAEMSLKAMFQVRGFHRAIFTLKDGVLYVNLGKPTTISAIELIDAPEGIKIRHKREIVGEKLTPAKLDELKDWLTQEAKHLGFPCPKVSVSADFETGKIKAELKSGHLSNILSVNSAEISDLHPGVIRRYDAFHVGDQFDLWNVAITERRVLDDDLVSGNHFTEVCTDDGVLLKQSIQAGLPRLFTFGIGFDTQQGPLFKISSHYSRMNQRGSSLDTSLSTSFRIQEFLSSFNWYVLRGPSRFFLKPNIDVKRDSEPDYTTFSTKAAMPPTLSWDDSLNRWEISLGPTFEIDQTLAGLGPSYSQILALSQTLLLTSHGFEYYKASPQRGYKISLNSSLSSQAIVSTITAAQLSLSGEALFNLGSFSPPSVVFGLRGAYGTTITPNGGSDLSLLPIPYRYYLGGSQDLRGFSRQELPDNSGVGAMTAVYLGWETRFLALLPYNLQPFVFTDAGALGVRPNSLDWPLYWSPGIGLRWASPIGAFRFEGAHGFLDSPTVALNSDRSHFEFYLSYGEEF